MKMLQVPCGAGCSDFFTVFTKKSRKKFYLYLSRDCYVVVILIYIIIKIIKSIRKNCKNCKKVPIYAVCSDLFCKNFVKKL